LHEFGTNSSCKLTSFVVCGFDLLPLFVGGVIFSSLVVFWGMGWLLVGFGFVFFFFEEGICLHDA